MKTPGDPAASRVSLEPAATVRILAVIVGAVFVTVIILVIIIIAQGR